MSIEISELIVNVTIDEGPKASCEQPGDDFYWDLEEIKAQIISECKDLFYELLDKQGDR